MTPALIACQVAVVLFMALHDWLPLGALNNLRAVRASDSRARLLVVTILSTLPFAIVLAGTIAGATGRRAGWAVPAGAVAYGLMIVGILRAWWIPYAVRPDPARARRYQARFADTHAWLPRRNGIRPDTLHTVFHALAVATFVLFCIAAFG